MRTLRYLLIVFGLVSILGVCAQGLAQQPEATMHSTSIMVGSGSALPSAAVEGVSTTYSPTNTPSGPRRIGGGNSGGGTGPTNPDDPWATPIGDAVWMLTLCALVYTLFTIVRRKKHLTK